MTEVKFVINNKEKSYQKVLGENPYLNLKLGDKVQGDNIGLEGYELEIRGASDKSGCPLRRDIQGFGKKKALLASGTGVRGLKKGKRIRKTVAGNQINEDVVQINLKILKQGSKKIEEIFPPKEGEKRETLKVQESEPKTTKEKVKEQPKVEEKKTEEPIKAAV